MIAASFAALSGKCVIADCDVDAANMHLLLDPLEKEKHEFKAGLKAYIDRKECIECGKCGNACRFNAISAGYVVDEMSCEGCGLCAKICPAGAVSMKQSLAAHWFVSETKYGGFVHARLGIAEDNSGKLVTKVRETALKKAGEGSADIVIVDGPPGTGCPVMAAITGMDFIVIVTEPTVSGVHDLKRVLEVAEHFKVRAGVIVNKYDINEEKTRAIEAFCRENKVLFLGKVPFSRCVVEAVNAGIPPVLKCDDGVKNAIIGAWKKARAAAA
jgi:MinD superfamily P-loop ATPase